MGKKRETKPRSYDPTRKESRRLRRRISLFCLNKQHYFCYSLTCQCPCHPDPSKITC